MTPVIGARLDKSPKYLQPNHLADYLSTQQNYALFLDIDGTLADFTLNPKDSFIPESTLALLQEIQNHGVQIAIVTGRNLTEAKTMLWPLQLPIAATHGLEIDFADDADHNHDYYNNSDSDKISTGPVDSTVHVDSTVQVDTSELTAIKQAIRQAYLSHDGFTIEDKPHSVALHYRKNPALAEVAAALMAQSLKDYPNWALKPGKYVWEAAPKGVNKGSAILTLLSKMHSDTKQGYELCPIFIGDDITDEAGFAAVQGDNSSNETNGVSTLNRAIPASQSLITGLGIKVGIEPTCAHYYVYTIYEVHSLLKSFLIFIKQCGVSSLDLIDATSPPSKK